MPGLEALSCVLKKTSLQKLEIRPKLTRKKASIILVIKNKVLNNYIIPYLKDVKFRTKKGKLDFLDFTDICKAVYKGSHRSEEIRFLIKLSYNMNNFKSFKKQNILHQKKDIRQ